MTDKQQAYYRDIQEALVHLGEICEQLKFQNMQLMNENSSLKEELSKQKRTNGAMSDTLSLDENHKTALKHQLSSHLKRLDEILKTS